MTNFRLTRSGLGKGGGRRPLFLLIGALLLYSCQPTAPPRPLATTGHETRAFGEAFQADDFFVVDCLLPGQIRKLGRMTFQSARRPVKTTARDCEIRGGEYVAFDRADYKTALSVWLTRAEAGDAEAQTYVGDIYLKGLGAEPRYDLAAQWYRKAAANGDVRAQMSLAYLYEKGLGVPRNQEESLDWYRKAGGIPESVTLEEEGLNSLERKELSDLKAEVERYKKETGDLRLQLQSARGDLEMNRQKEEARGKALETEKARLERAVEDLREQKKLSGDVVIGEVRKLDQDLTRKERELVAKTEEIAALRERIKIREMEASGYQRDLEALREKIANLPPPFIEVSDPPVRIARGVRIAYVEPTPAMRSIAGRVWAPAGIDDFLVNGRGEPVKSDGTFRAEVPVTSSGRTEVRIVARDVRGKQGTVEFSLEAREEKPLPGSPKADFSSIDFGNYVALIIGNKSYSRLPRLETPEKDAEAIADILRRKYGFQTTVLLNATRLEILKSLEKFLKSLNERDNFLIYYAGHGELDTKNRRGYWLPVDADQDSTVNWIPNIAVTDYLNIMSAKQVLVIADTCYSGIMTRSAIPALEPGMTDEVRWNFIRKLAQLHSRMVLSSGEEAPVLDAGGGGHSVFAKVLLDILKANDDVIEGRRLHQMINDKVLYESEKYGLPQIPQYAALIQAGHQSGDFLLVPRGD